jgi:protein-disulfide isomerase
VNALLIAFPRDLRVVFKNMPLSFHEHAMSAAIGGVCADEQGKFWPWYDALYSDQTKLGDSDLLAVAQRLSLDIDQFTTCQASAQARQKVQDDLSLATDLGTPGTPTFYINGRELDGALPFDTFRGIIDDEITKAQASGVDRADYYDKVVLGN